jgi:hypothetical protein
MVGDKDTTSASFAARGELLSAVYVRRRKKPMLEHLTGCRTSLRIKLQQGAHKLVARRVELRPYLVREPWRTRTPTSVVQAHPPGLAPGAVVLLGTDSCANRGATIS